MTWTNWSCVTEYEVAKGERGICACGQIAAGELIGIYDGEIVACDLEGDRLVDRDAHRYLVQLHRTAGKLFAIVSSELSGIDFINHSCKANVRPVDRVVLVAARDIEPGEALTLDYTRWDLVPEGIRCWCPGGSCVL